MRAALAVEVARGDIDQLDQPLAQRAEALRRHAHAAVADGRPGGGEVPRDAAYHVRLDAAVRRRALRRECRDGLAHRVQAAGERRQVAGVGEILGEQRVQDRGEEQGVAAGDDGVVVARQLCRFGPARVDDHEPAAASPAAP
jgi:hypothetical protein